MRIEISRTEASPLMRDATSEIFSEITRLSRLSPGWLYGEGQAIKRSEILRATRIVSEMQQFGLREFEAFPEEGGGMMISGYIDGDCLEVICRADGRYECFFSVAGEKEEASGDVSEAAAIGFIRRPWPSALAP